MSTLAPALKWLSKSCSRARSSQLLFSKASTTTTMSTQQTQLTMVVGPDPRQFPPIPPYAGATYRQYQVKFLLSSVISDIAPSVLIDDGNMISEDAEVAEAWMKDGFYARVHNTSLWDSGTKTDTRCDSRRIGQELDAAHISGKTISSPWMALLNSHRHSGLSHRSASPTTDESLQETLLVLLQNFPTYNLSTTRGINEIVDHIQTTLEPFASMPSETFALTSASLLDSVRGSHPEAGLETIARLEKGTSERLQRYRIRSFDNLDADQEPDGADDERQSFIFRSPRKGVARSIF